MLFRYMMSPKIRIHPIFIFIFLVSSITGMFSALLIFCLIIVWHEWGHYMLATYFQWDIEQVSFHFFGGVIETSEWMDRSIMQSLCVTIGGPIQHLFIFILLQLCQVFSVLPASILMEAH